MVFKNKTLSVKILRGINLLAMDHHLLSEDSSDPYCEVWEETSSGGKRKILRTPVQPKTLNPIWGGPLSTCVVSERSSITIRLFDFDELKYDDPMGVVTFRPRELLAESEKKGYPNVWVPVKKVDSDQDAGMLEVRVLRPPTKHRHHDLGQSMKTLLSPGPKLGNMKKEKLESLFTSSNTPVICHVYDVSNDERIGRINAITKLTGMGGIFHAAIEVYGREYSFGGSKEPGVTGVFACPPRKCPMHTYRESFFLGDCDLSYETVESVLDKMRSEWFATSYDVLRKNCAFFSQELAIELGVGSIPKFVYSLANTGAFVQEKLSKEEDIEFLKNKQAGPTTPQIIWDKPLSKEHNTDSVREILHLAEGIQNITLDHIMAIRVQRAFRSSMILNPSMKVRGNKAQSIRASAGNIEISLEGELGTVS